MFVKEEITSLQWHALVGLCRSQEDCVFLDSSQPGHPNAHFSLLALCPFLTVAGTEDMCEIVDAKETVRKENKALHEVVSSLLERYSFNDLQEQCADFPIGGAFGFVSYDYSARVHGINVSSTARDSGAWFGFYDITAVYDLADEKYFLVSTGLPQADDAQRKQRAATRIDEILAMAQTVPEIEYRDIELCLESAQYSQEEYARKIDCIHEYISSGDSYQVNFSRLFKLLPTSENGFDIYRSLCSRNPVPFGAFVRAGGIELLSFSMERFLSINGLTIQTRPIKGTAPRGKDEAEDKLIISTLAGCEKNRAELIMIVDLMRNDLGRVCESGTVVVDDLCRIETYAGVHHMVATVSGKLRKHFSPVDVLISAMPGGSVTGAPKIRTMEIINELEDGTRGLYCGCLGYFGFNAVSDFNILIRSLVNTQDYFSFRSGGGITSGSEAADEYQETIHKIKLFCSETDSES